MHSFIHAFIHSFMHSVIHSFVQTLHATQIKNTIEECNATLAQPHDATIHETAFLADLAQLNPCHPEKTRFFTQTPLLIPRDFS